MVTSVESHAVPSFYACYLMRSYATTSSSRTYIGSTPDPIRRKKQHNGVLTQGAHKTQRGRPWETQFIVWGFPSKIAALQFEWAWQKPHLSRHLRTHVDHDGSSSSQHVPLPLFTDTPMNQVPTSADGCKALSCTSVQSCLLVARALLRSEPFSAWNLRITFFEEYCWAAWVRLEDDLSREISRDSNLDAFKVVGLKNQKSRLGRALAPKHLTPAPICDFQGVDGSRKSLLQLSETERSALKLEAKASKSVQVGKSPGQWPEKLPKTLTVRAMGGTWNLLQKAPLPPYPVGCANSVEGQVPKMRLNDDAQMELSWQRYKSVLKGRSLSLETIKSTTSSEALLQDCALCRSSISLQDHLTYTTCPAPFHELRPRAAMQEDTRKLTQFGFTYDHQGLDRPESPSSPSSHCHSFFHIACLAKHFSIQQRRGPTDFVLPTHGRCPSCGVQGKEEDANTWVEVIRAVYRRTERLETEIANERKAALQEEKVRARNAAKKTTNTMKATRPHKVTPPPEERSSEDGTPSGSLLDALDEIQRRPRGKRSFRPVSTLLRDPIQPSSTSSHSASFTAPPSTPTPSMSTAKRSSLLCNLDSVLNAAACNTTSATTRFDPKRVRSTFATATSPSNEVIDLT
ncbi:hypothetical protein CBS101457_002215 [Exobasidium rhododendri]|nr:hypothetical protein CBS101457_002215 [Exobasidium rhododendri]